MVSSEIGVIIVCYNQAHFLEEAVRSVLTQTLVAEEIILVDDGSSDDTAVVAARYPSVRYIRQENAGLSAARNNGLALTGARFVLFLDSDDVLTPDALAAALPVLLADPLRAFVFGGYREVTEDRTSLSIHHPTVPEDMFDGLLRRGNYISMHGTVLYDADRLRRSGGFDTALRSCEDYDVYLRLTREHPVAAYSLIAAEYRRHGESLSRNTLHMIDTSHAVLGRHSLTDVERAAARKGRAVFTAYYGDRFWWSVAGSLRRRQFRTAGESLRQLIARPRLWLPLAVRAVATRGGRAFKRFRA